MMRFGGWGGSAAVGSDFGLLTTIFSVVILIDLILLGVWLWKQINKK